MGDLNEDLHVAVLAVKQKCAEVQQKIFAEDQSLPHKNGHLNVRRYIYALTTAKKEGTLGRRSRSLTRVYMEEKYYRSKSAPHPDQVERNEFYEQDFTPQGEERLEFTETIDAPLTELEAEDVAHVQRVARKLPEGVEPWTHELVVTEEDGESGLLEDRTLTLRSGNHPYGSNHLNDVAESLSEKIAEFFGVRDEIRKRELSMSVVPVYEEHGTHYVSYGLNRSSSLSSIHRRRQEERRQLDTIEVEANSRAELAADSLPNIYGTFGSSYGTSSTAWSHQREPGFLFRYDQNGKIIQESYGTSGLGRYTSSNGAAQVGGYTSYGSTGSALGEYIFHGARESQSSTTEAALGHYTSHGSSEAVQAKESQSSSTEVGRYTYGSTGNVLENRQYDTSNLGRYTTYGSAINVTEANKSSSTGSVATVVANPEVTKSVHRIETTTISEPIYDSVAKEHIYDIPEQTPAPILASPRSPVQLPKNFGTYYGAASYICLNPYDYEAIMARPLHYSYNSESHREVLREWKEHEALERVKEEERRAYEATLVQTQTEEVHHIIEEVRQEIEEHVEHSLHRALELDHSLLEVEKTIIKALPQVEPVQQEILLHELHRALELEHSLIEEITYAKSRSSTSSTVRVRSLEEDARIQRLLEETAILEENARIAVEKLESSRRSSGEEYIVLIRGVELDHLPWDVVGYSLPPDEPAPIYDDYHDDEHIYAEIEDPPEELFHATPVEIVYDSTSSDSDTIYVGNAALDRAMSGYQSIREVSPKPAPREEYRDDKTIYVGREALASVSSKMDVVEKHEKLEKSVLERVKEIESQPGAGEPPRRSWNALELWGSANDVSTSGHAVGGGVTIHENFCEKSSHADHHQLTEHHSSAFSRVESKEHEFELKHHQEHEERHHHQEHHHEQHHDHHHEQHHEQHHEHHHEQHHEQHHEHHHEHHHYHHEHDLLSKKHDHDLELELLAAHRFSGHERDCPRCRRLAIVKMTSSFSGVTSEELTTSRVQTSAFESVQKETHHVEVQTEKKPEPKPIARRTPPVAKKIASRFNPIRKITPMLVIPAPEPPRPVPKRLPKPEPEPVKPPEPERPKRKPWVPPPKPIQFDEEKHDHPLGPVIFHELMLQNGILRKKYHEEQTATLTRPVSRPVSRANSRPSTPGLEPKTIDFPRLDQVHPQDLDFVAEYVNDRINTYNEKERRASEHRIHSLERTSQRATAGGIVAPRPSRSTETHQTRNSAINVVGGHVGGHTRHDHYEHGLERRASERHTSERPAVGGIVVSQPSHEIYLIRSLELNEVRPHVGGHASHGKSHQEVHRAELERPKPIAVGNFVAVKTGDHRDHSNELFIARPVLAGSVSGSEDGYARFDKNKYEDVSVAGEIEDVDVDYEIAYANQAIRRMSRHNRWSEDEMKSPVSPQRRAHLDAAIPLNSPFVKPTSPLSPRSPRSASISPNPRGDLYTTSHFSSNEGKYERNAPPRVSLRTTSYTKSTGHLNHSSDHSPSGYHNLRTSLGKAKSELYVNDEYAEVPPRLEVGHVKNLSKLFSNPDSKPLSTSQIIYKSAPKSQHFVGDGVSHEHHHEQQQIVRPRTLRRIPLDEVALHERNTHDSEHHEKPHEINGNISKDSEHSVHYASSGLLNGHHSTFHHSSENDPLTVKVRRVYKVIHNGASSVLSPTHNEPEYSVPPDAQHRPTVDDLLL